VELVCDYKRDSDATGKLAAMSIDLNGEVFLSKKE
jgi:hypothetical protein